MRTIHKYTLMITDEQRIATHEGAVPLAVGEQRGMLTLWMEVDTAAPKSERVVHVVGTGNPMPKVEMTYVGTRIVGMFVWHVYIEDTER